MRDPTRLRHDPSGRSSGVDVLLRGARRPQPPAPDDLARLGAVVDGLSRQPHVSAPHRWLVGSATAVAVIAGLGTGVWALRGGGRTVAPQASLAPARVVAARARVEAEPPAPLEQPSAPVAAAEPRAVATRPSARRPARPAIAPRTAPAAPAARPRRRATRWRARSRSSTPAATTWPRRRRARWRCWRPTGASSRAASSPPSASSSRSRRCSPRIAATMRAAAPPTSRPATRRARTPRARPVFWTQGPSKGPCNPPRRAPPGKARRRSRDRNSTRRRSPGAVVRRLLFVWCALLVACGAPRREQIATEAAGGEAVSVPLRRSGDPGRARAVRRRARRRDRRAQHRVSAGGRDARDQHRRDHVPVAARRRSQPRVPHPAGGRHEPLRLLRPVHGGDLSVFPARARLAGDRLRPPRRRAAGDDRGDQRQPAAACSARPRSACASRPSR